MEAIVYIYINFKIMQNIVANILYFCLQQQYMFCYVQRLLVEHNIIKKNEKEVLTLPLCIPILYQLL